MAAQAWQIYQLDYQIQQEEALIAVETNIQVKIARLQNLANLYIQLNQLIPTVNQQNQQIQVVPSPPPQN